MSKVKYWGSRDEELFYLGGYATRKAVADEIFRDEPDLERLWIGEGKPCSASEFFPCSDDILEIMACRAYDNVGEAAEDWLQGATGSEQEELTRRIHSVLEEWIRETKQEPSFCRIVEVREHSRQDWEDGKL